MTVDEKYIRDVLTFFYPDNPPSGVNAQLGDLAARMLYAAFAKSKALDLVPRPPAGVPGFGWLAKEGVRIFFYTHRATKIYSSARVAVALQHRTEYELLKAQS